MSLATSLPVPVLGAAFSACAAEDLARLECCATAFCAGDPAFCGVAPCAAEFAAREAVMELLGPGGRRVALGPGESWKVLWFIAAEIAGQAAASQRWDAPGGDEVWPTARRAATADRALGALGALSSDGDVADVGTAHLRGVAVAIARLASRAGRRTAAPMAAAGRAVRLALALGAAGRWSAGAQLLHLASDVLRDDGDGECWDTGVNERRARRAELLAAASGFLVDKCYASTYVASDESECRDVVRALDFASRAVDLARRPPEAPSAGRGASRVRIGLAQRVGEAPERRRQRALAAALYSEGRASAICGQHQALGAMLPDEGGRSGPLPPVTALFARGQAAFCAAWDLARELGEAQEAARAMAGLGELWYCAASANTRDSAALAPGEPGHEQFEEHAGLPPVPDFDALAQEVGPRLRAFVWALRLSHASLRLSQEALGVLRGLAEEESLLAAQVMKDMGKVHGFVARFRPALFTLAGVRPDVDHEAESQEYLTQALIMQQRLQGVEHKNTANVRRLLGEEQPLEAWSSEDEAEYPGNAYLDDAAPGAWAGAAASSSEGAGSRAGATPTGAALAADAPASMADEAAASDFPARRKDRRIPVSGTLVIALCASVVVAGVAVTSLAHCRRRRR